MHRAHSYRLARKLVSSVAFAFMWSAYEKNRFLAIIHVSSKQALMLVYFIKRDKPSWYETATPNFMPLISTLKIKRKKRRDKFVPYSDAFKGIQLIRRGKTKVLTITVDGLTYLIPIST